MKISFPLVWLSTFLLWVFLREGLSYKLNNNFWHMEKYFCGGSLSRLLLVTVCVWRQQNTKSSPPCLKRSHRLNVTFFMAINLIHQQVLRNIHNSQNTKLPFYLWLFSFLSSVSEYICFNKCISFFAWCLWRKPDVVFLLSFFFGSWAGFRAEWVKNKYFFQQFRVTKR